jgi:paraquat-inducible protein B
MNRKKVIGALILLDVLIVAALVYWFGFYTKGLDISIVFDEAKGVSRGTKLVMKGIPIGEVRGVKVEESGEVVVEARIYREYKDRVNSSAVFIIEPVDTGLQADERWIVVEVIDENAPSLERGARVRGYKSRAQFFVQSGKRALERAYEEFANWLVEFEKGFEEFRRDKRYEELKDEMNALMDEVVRSAQRGIEELRKEMPRIKERLESILRELRELGRDREADRFKEEFDRYLKNLEDGLKET